MFKSTILFLLLGSLVILFPFGTSMNIISKAMALNIVPSMNNDEQDYLQRYEKFYKDDSFREDYYNYHKQHHQQEQQQIENEPQQSIGQEPQQHHHHHQKQLEKDVQQSIGQKLQQQKQNSLTESLTQQKSPSSTSQEQMHQQQIIKLKQFLEALR